MSTDNEYVLDLAVTEEDRRICHDIMRTPRNEALETLIVIIRNRPDLRSASLSMIRRAVRNQDSATAVSALEALALLVGQCPEISESTFNIAKIAAKSRDADISERGLRVLGKINVEQLTSSQELLLGSRLNLTRNRL